MENKRFKILAVDDNKDNLVILKALIMDAFKEAEVLSAVSGQQGFYIAEVEEPDVILLDIIMPGMDGFEVCTRLKADKRLRDIPVVFVTALKGDKENRIKALECGAEAFLSKPIDEIELTAQIRAMIKIRAANLQKRDEKQLLAALVEEKTRELKESNIKTLQLFEALKKEQRLTEAIFDSIQGYLFVYDEYGKLIKWNKKHETITGFTAEELSHMTLEKWFDKEDILKVNAAVHDVFEKGYGEVEAQLILKNGEKLMTRSSGAPFVWDGRKYFAGIGVDITEQLHAKKILKEKELALIKSEAKYRQITESISDVVWTADLNLNTIYVSPSVEKMLGESVQAHLNRSFEEKLKSDSLKRVHQVLAEELEREKDPRCDKKRSRIIEVEHYHADGSTIWVSMHVSFLRDDNGKVIGFQGVSRDITQRKKVENELLYLSYHDHLTGLYNRRFFEEELKRVDTNQNLPLSIILCDVNGLKLVNDSFGHDSGDQLLIMAADAIRNACRKEAVIARIGGDEFVVLLPKVSAIETVQIANQIKEMASLEKVANIELSLSYGYDTKTNVKQPINEVIANAENYMYRHKLYERSSIRSKTIDLIMNALYEKSNREAMHSSRVSSICQSIAVKMNFDKDAVNQMKIAGLIHDIGKIGVDEKILNKPGSLTNNERKDVQRHPEIGWRLLSSTNEFTELAQFVLNHHEKWDGSGYPNGLKKDTIPLEARIIAVADAYDAMTSKRSYKSIIDQEEAVNELMRCAGTHFDPEIVEIFVNQVLKI